MWYVGGENVVDWDFTLNELVPGEPLTAPVQALRCDGHQHAGLPFCLLLYLVLEGVLLVATASTYRGANVLWTYYLLSVPHVVRSGSL